MSDLTNEVWRTEYVPPEISKHFTAPFLKTFFKALGEVFNHDMLSKVFLLMGTRGWRVSLEKAAKEHDCMSVVEHYDRLEWVEAMNFDGTIVDAMLKHGVL